MGYGFDYGFDYGYGYDYGMSMPQVSNAAGTVFLALLGVYFLLFLYGIAAYVMGSLGHYTIAERRGIKHPWLAWLPYGNLWILGSIADQYQYVSLGQVKSSRKVLLGLEIAKGVLGLGMIVLYVKMLVDILINAGGNVELLNEESMIAILLGFVVMILAAWVLSIILIVFRYIALYHLFGSCRPNCQVAFILLSILLSFTEPFLVFACRKKDGGMPPRKAQPVYEEPVRSIPQPVVEPVVEVPAEEQVYAPVDPPAFEEE